MAEQPPQTPQTPAGWAREQTVNPVYEGVDRTFGGASSSAGRAPPEEDGPGGGGGVTMPTTTRELWAWYLYDWANVLAFL